MPGDSQPTYTDFHRSIVDYIASTQHKDGGFGGGQGQYGHLATSYASVLTLYVTQLYQNLDLFLLPLTVGESSSDDFRFILGTKAALDTIDREKMYSFLLSVKREDGSFSTHVGGDHDVRYYDCDWEVNVGFQ